MAPVLKERLFLTVTNMSISDVISMSDFFVSSIDRSTFILKTAPWTI